MKKPVLLLTAFLVFAVASYGWSISGNNEDSVTGKWLVSDADDEYKKVLAEEGGVSAKLSADDLWYYYRGEKINVAPFVSTKEMALIFESDAEEYSIKNAEALAYFKERFKEIRAHNGRYLIYLFAGLPSFSDTDQFFEFMHKMNLEARERELNCSLAPVFYFPGEGARVLSGNLIIRSVKKMSKDENDAYAEFLLSRRLYNYSLKLIFEKTQSAFEDDYVSMAARITRYSNFNVFQMAYNIYDAPTPEELMNGNAKGVKRDMLEVTPEFLHLPGALHASVRIEEPSDAFVGSTWYYIIELEGDPDMYLLSGPLNPGQTDLKDFIEKSKLLPATLKISKPEIIAVNDDNNFRQKIIIKYPFKILSPGTHTMTGFKVWYVFNDYIDKVNDKNYRDIAYNLEIDPIKIYVAPLASPEMSDVYPPAGPNRTNISALPAKAGVYFAALFACLGLLLLYSGRTKKENEISAESGKTTAEAGRESFSKKLGRIENADQAKDLLAEFFEWIKKNYPENEEASDIIIRRRDLRVEPAANDREFIETVKTAILGGFEELKCVETHKPEKGEIGS